MIGGKGSFLAGNTNLENLYLFNDEEREDFWEGETMTLLDIAPLAPEKVFCAFGVVVRRSNK